jgi:hypothetical protein
MIIKKSYYGICLNISFLNILAFLVQVYTHISQLVLTFRLRTLVIIIRAHEWMVLDWGAETPQIHT